MLCLNQFIKSLNLFFQGFHFGVMNIYCQKVYVVVCKQVRYNQMIGSIRRIFV